MYNDLDFIVKQRPHLAYARDVIDGKIIANKMVIATCNRSINDHAADLFENDNDSRWYYDQSFASAVVDFAAQCPHVEGTFALLGKTFILPPWQLYFVSELYGWRKKGQKHIRRFTEGYLEVAKKNGKSSLAAVLCLYELLFGDRGGKIFTTANGAKNCRVIWDIALMMVKSKNFPLKFRKDIDVVGDAIKSSRGIYEFLKVNVGSHEKLDGLNPSLIVFDEAGAIEERNIIEKTSTIGRDSPLRLYITHAQYSTETIYFTNKQAIERSLSGELDMEYIDHIMPLFYSVDEIEDIDSERNWIKANPNLGESILWDNLRKLAIEYKTTVDNSRKLYIQTYHYCLWLSSADRWLDNGAIEACSRVVQRPKNVCLGIDLSATDDLTVVARIWQVGREWHCDFMCWTIQKHIDSLPEFLKPIYNQAIEDGILIVQDEEAIDYQDIYDYIIETSEEYNILSIGYDDWNAREFIKLFKDEPFPVAKVVQSLANLNDTRQSLGARIAKKRLVFDGNPFICWQFNNVAIGKNNRNDYLKLEQPPNAGHLKIDAFAALVTGARTTFEVDEPETSGYMTYTAL